MAKLIVDKKYLKQIEGNFAKLESQIADSANRTILNKAGRPITNELADDAPRHFGLLRKALQGSKKTKKYKNRRGHSVIYISGVDTSFVVNRSDYTKVSPKAKRYLRIRPAKYLNIVLSGNKFGAPAQPFVERAFENKKGKSLEIIERQLPDVIEKAAARIYTKAAAKI